MRWYRADQMKMLEGQRIKLLANKLTHKEIGEIFGVNQSHVTRIINGDRRGK